MGRWQLHQPERSPNLSKLPTLDHVIIVIISIRMDHEHPRGPMGLNHTGLNEVGVPRNNPKHRILKIGDSSMLRRVYY